MDPFSLTRLNPFASSNLTNSLNFKIVSYSPDRILILAPNIYFYIIALLA